MSSQPQDEQTTGRNNDQNTDVEELNEDGVGGTMGAESSFEPEEDEDGAKDDA